jgi:uncharacterized membrane protein YoaK (UPF0700 family)
MTINYGSGAPCNTTHRREEKEMTLTNAIGYLLMASPFIGVAIFSAVMGGFLATLAIFGVAGAIMGTIVLGGYLASR